MGRASADVNLRGTQRAFVRDGDPHLLLCQNRIAFQVEIHADQRRPAADVGLGIAGLSLSTVPKVNKKRLVHPPAQAKL